MSVIINFMGNLGLFTYIYLVIQLIVFAGLLYKYVSSKKIEKITLDNIQQEIEKKHENNELITNYSLNELFKKQNEKSKYVEQWKRYYKRIFNKEADEKIKVEPYLGTSALHFAIGERGILESGGGIHTSVGVLGTFLGLTIGLAGLEVSNVEQLKNGIDGLLSGMTAAFMTSVLGVILSIIWIFIDRHLTIRIEDKIDWHANELSLLLNTDDEEIFLSRLEKISAQQAEQITTLLTDALEKTFTPFMQTLQSNNENMTNGLTKMESRLQAQNELTTSQLEQAKQQSEALGEKVVKIIQISNDNLASGFINMETQLQSQNELTQQQIELTRNQTHEISEKLVQTLTEDTKGVIEEFMQVITHSKDFQENLVDVVGGITTQFEQASEKQEQLFVQSEKMVQTYASLSEGMEKSQTSYEKTSEELAALSLSLKEVQQLSNAQLPLQQEILSRSSEFVESSNDLIVQFSKFGNQLQASQDTMLEQLMKKTELISNRFEQLAKELAQASEGYLDANNKNVELLSKTEQAVDQLDPVLGYMASTSESLENTMTQLELLQTRQAELIPHLREWNEDVLTYLKNFVSLSEKQMKEITGQSAYAKAQWDSTANTFENTSKKLDVAMENFAIDIKKGLTVTFQEFDTELTKVVRNFNAISGTYLESQENLTEAMSETVEKLMAVRGKE